MNYGGDTDIQSEHHLEENKRAKGSSELLCRKWRPRSGKRWPDLGGEIMFVRAVSITGQKFAHPSCSLCSLGPSRSKCQDGEKACERKMERRSWKRWGSHPIALQVWTLWRRRGKEGRKVWWEVLASSPVLWKFGKAALGSLSLSHLSGSLHLAGASLPGIHSALSSWLRAASDHRAIWWMWWGVQMAASELPSTCCSSRREAGCFHGCHSLLKCAFPCSLPRPLSRSSQSTL